MTIFLTLISATVLRAGEATGTWVQPGKRYDVLVGKRGIDGPLCLELRKVLELPEEVRTKANAEAR